MECECIECIGYTNTNSDISACVVKADWSHYTKLSIEVFNSCKLKSKVCFTAEFFFVAIIVCIWISTKNLSQDCTYTVNCVRNTIAGMVPEFIINLVFAGVCLVVPNNFKTFYRCKVYGKVW